VTAVERQPTKGDIVEAELKRIWDERAELRASYVLDEARHDDSPLHQFFQWDDTAAAEGFRLFQAAALIRSVKLRVTSTDQRGQVTDYVVRAWQPARYVDDSDTGKYLPVEMIREDPKVREALIRQMGRDAETFRRRYSHLTEFAQVVRGLIEGDTADD
jgi:hypothetical protein